MNPADSSRYGHKRKVHSMVPPTESLMSAAVEAYKKRKDEVDATEAMAEDTRYLNETITLYKLVSELKGTSRYSCILKACLIAGKQHPTLTLDGLVFCVAKKVSENASEREVALLMKCTTCGRGAYSPPISNLVMLGEVIQEFQPKAKCGRCRDFSDHRQIMQNLKNDSQPIVVNGGLNPVSPGIDDNGSRKVRNINREQRDPTIELMPNFSDLVMSL
jgi:hypothetical protein